MAEEEEKEDGKEGGEEGGKKKSNMILFIVIGALVLLLIIVAVVVMMMMGGDEEAAADPAAAGAAGAATQQAAAARPKTNSDMLTVGPMHPLDQFIVNLLSQSGRRYLKTTMNLELDNEALVAELTNKEAVIRDIIISVLSSKTIEEISTSKGKDKLKEELTIKVNEVLVDGQIKNVFFTDFVIQ